MKKNTFRRRLNTMQAILAVLLLIGIALIWQTESTHRKTVQRTARLYRTQDRVFADLMVMNDALQMLVLDPKNEAERKRSRAAATDLGAATEALEQAVVDRPKLVDTANQLHALYRQIADQAEADATSAATYYRKNYSAIQSQREKLIKDLNREVETLVSAELSRAEVGEFLSLGCIALVLIGGVVLVWFQSAAVARPVYELTETLERMRRGDFTQRLALDDFDEFNELSTGLNRLAEDLSALVGQVQRSGIQVNATATQIAATAKEQQSTAHEIAATTAEIGTTSKEISTTSKELVKTIDEVSRVADDTARLANSGQTAIGRMEATMRQIMDASGAITAKLAALSEKTANINSVVTTITKVADQTNLLSLNAAIEAEKAGEYGLGFAVVAMEIRRLADQTAVATYDIEKSVKEMQSAVAAGVMGLDKFSDEVRRGVEEIRQVSTQLAQIIRQVQALTPRFQAVNEGMHAQATGAQQISETLTQLSEAARQTAESMRQSNLAIEQLNDASRGLQTSVARYKVEG
jgi:methyl-accepting chemotaxis protein WspA